MEVKVSVDGVPRVVCGVTEETTCQEVVVALAQALGQPGRYMLREKFKEFERCMTPSERLLETLEKYGEQAREVQLTLLLSGPPVLDEMSRTNVGRYQPCPPLRRKDAGARMRRGSGSLSLHRQSLPPLPCLRHEAEQPKEDIKRPKRKSLTLMEEAWEWLENLGKGKVYSTACDKDRSKKSDKKNRTSLNVLLTPDKENLGSGSKVRGQKGLMSDLDHQTSCCIGSQTKGKASKHSKKRQEAKSYDRNSLSSAIIDDERNRLKETVLSQLGSLQDLEAHIARVDKQILELEEKQRARRAEQEAQQRMAEQEIEQIMFWENELKAEERHEKDLQGQFLQIKAKTVECKAMLQEHKDKIKGLHFFGPQNVVAKREDLEKVGANATTEVSAKDANQQPSDRDRGLNVNRKFLHRDASNSHVLISPSHIKERRPTGPTELREWWKRWSEARNAHLQAKQPIHRSELTVYLGSTKDENKGMRTKMKENTEL
ncbi:ras association domain-containing protein 8-like [Solea senegalensis]|uniref:Ras association domain-containing protein 8-like n=1 Tax=Solea senegalensis TaxID=28829 RepID=A0AAV6SUL1_SOLSE|nr:ras association domain-containing protein 8 [Solea senegalensis]KAG7521181.1 ras association domain-containing protein 8-like [Solea senegalensis]